MSEAQPTDVTPARSASSPLQGLIRDGLRTLIGVVAATLAARGLEISPDDQGAILAALMIVVSGGLAFAGKKLRDSGGMDWLANLI